MTFRRRGVVHRLLPLYWDNSGEADDVLDIVISSTSLAASVSIFVEGFLAPQP
jgi:hypothetical protein